MADAVVKSWSAFLTETPPYKEELVNELGKVEEIGQLMDRIWLVAPDLRLECDNEGCGGARRFIGDTPTGFQVERNDSNAGTVKVIPYKCANCNKSLKLFSVKLWGFRTAGDFRATAVKIGEHPPFGPSIPTRVIALVGPDRDNFLKGWRCENQGMGIGAYSYYRRVIENQKNRFLDSIIKVAERTTGSESAIALLKAAQTETQFSKAVHSIRDCVPDSLKISGHNPITLLHSALSEGLHEGDEAWCLDRAHAIHHILFDLAERIGAVLKDTAELDKAISKLLKSPAKGSGA
jgi:hypothetical protein